MSGPRTRLELIHHVGLLVDGHDLGGIIEVADTQGAEAHAHAVIAQAGDGGDAVLVQQHGGLAGTVLQRLEGGGGIGDGVDVGVVGIVGVDLVLGPDKELGDGAVLIGGDAVDLVDDSAKVVAVYEQPDVMDQFKIVQQWMENGLINSDASTAAEATGMCGVGIAQGWPAAAKGWGDGRGAEVVVSQFGEPVLSTDTVQGSLACVSTALSFWTRISST